MSALLDFAGLVWHRPWALALLALPLALLLLRELARDPARELSGTLSIWRKVASSAPSSARSPRRWSVALLLGALALGCAALALAAPELRAARTAAGLRVVIDRSPSLYLPWSSGAERGGTRLDRALDLARVWIDASGVEREAIEWISPEDGGRARGAAPPAEWLSAPRVALAEPAWERWNDPATLWITDRAPRDPASVLAGWCASGGDAVPGPVSEGPREVMVWDGVSVRAAPPPARELALDPRLAVPLRELAGAWAASRGLALADVPSAATVLELCTADSGELAALEGERDGWSASGRGRALAAEDDESVWLASAAGTALVVVAPGRVRIGWESLDEPGGDPAAFAVSWSELFDSARLSSRDVVAQSERAAAGSEACAPARPAPAEDEREVTSLAPLFALCAAACALAALALA